MIDNDKCFLIISGMGSALGALGEQLLKNSVRGWENYSQCFHAWNICLNVKKGSLYNYVDPILSIITQLPIMYPPLHLVDICQGIPLPLHTLEISSTTYIPRLVNVVCERPLSENNDFEAIFYSDFRHGFSTRSRFPTPERPTKSGTTKSANPGNGTAIFKFDRKWHFGR